MVSVAMEFENSLVTGYERGRGRVSNLNGNTPNIKSVLTIRGKNIALHIKSITT